MSEDSLYLSSDLDGRIELAREACLIADQHRYEGPCGLHGHEGSNFCGMLSEYIMEISDEGFDEGLRFATSTSLYRDAQEYYPVFAPLLDGGEMGEFDYEEDE